jgi:DNA-binding beta-propeller fold protein YncE
VNGLAGAQSVVVSPDDKHVYVAGGEDNAVAVFRRGAEGRLTFVEFKKDGQGGVDGLHGAETVTLSPDGKFLYVAADIDDAVAVFARGCGERQR